MFEKIAPILAVVSCVCLLIMVPYVMSQQSQIDALKTSIEEMPAPTRAASSSNQGLLDYKRDTDARILKLESALAALKRQQPGQQVARQGVQQGNGAASGTPGQATGSPNLSASGAKQELMQAINDASSPEGKQLRTMFREESSRMRDQRQEQRFAQRQKEVAQRFKGFAMDFDLSDAQQTEVLSKLQEEHTQVFELRRAARSGDITREEAREQARAIRSETTEEVLKELDATQQEAFKQARESEREERRPRRGL